MNEKKETVNENLNTPIENKELDKVNIAADLFLKTIDSALEEAEENVRKLRTVRSAIKHELLGENFTGIKKVLDEAGAAIENRCAKEAADNEIASIIKENEAKKAV